MSTVFAAFNQYLGNDTHASSQLETERCQAAPAQRFTTANKI